MYSLAKVVKDGFNFFPLRPVGKFAKKNQLRECVFVNSALKYSAIIVKNTLLRLFFRRFCPQGDW